MIGLRLMDHPPYLPFSLMRCVFPVLLAVALSGCVVTPIADTSGEPAVVLLVPTFTPTPMPTATLPAPPQPSEVSSPPPAREATATEAIETAAAEATATPVPTATPTPSGLGIGYVQADVLNLRSGPIASFTVLGQLRKDHAVELLERNEDGTWWRVCCLADGATEGWISGAYLNLVLHAPALAVSDADAAAASRTLITDPHELWTYTSDLAFSQLPESRYSHPPSAPVNPLTGLPIAPERLAQRVLTVCIPSDVNARPQSGLSQADVVYEYLVDGFQITRMTGVFYGDDAPLIGPVRSARLINFYLGYFYNAATMCSGASDYLRRLLREMADFPFFDIDLDNPQGIYPYSFLLGSGLTRFHTNTQGMRRWLADASREQAMDVQGFHFGEPPTGGVPAAYVRIPYPTVSSAWVEFRYLPAAGRYLRSVGGQPHRDRNNNEQLAPHNVIVQYVPHQATHLVEDALGSRSLDQDIFGSGPAVIFRDGVMYEGTWHTDDLGRLTRFQDARGEALTLRPGRTWIALVPDGYLLAVE